MNRTKKSTEKVFSKKNIEEITEGKQTCRLHIMIPEKAVPGERLINGKSPRRDLSRPTRVTIVIDFLQRRHITLFSYCVPRE
jgi:hypothetical protein